MGLTSYQTALSRKKRLTAELAIRERAQKPAWSLATAINSAVKGLRAAFDEAELDQIGAEFVREHDRCANVVTDQLGFGL